MEKMGPKRGQEYRLPLLVLSDWNSIIMGAVTVVSGAVSLGNKELPTLIGRPINLLVLPVPAPETTGRGPQLSCM